MLKKIEGRVFSNAPANRGCRKYAAGVAALAAAALLSSTPLFAQFGAPSGSSQGTAAAQLPLSGRTAQSGGTVKTSEAPAPSTTSTVNTLSPNVQVQGTYAGSTPGISKMPFDGKLGLRDAVQRGLSYNLGETGATQALRQAQGQSKVARSSLLPNVNGTINENVQTTDLRAQGFRFSFPGFSIPNVIGPFNYIDFRAHLSQSLFDLTAINNYRAASEIAKANRYTAQDARELIVLAVGGAYLQAIAAKARVASEEAQLQSANAVYDQSQQQFAQGLIAKVDADRNQVQALTHQQRLLSLKNDLSKQKINLARMIGLPANDQYDLTDEIPFAPAAPFTVDAALSQAYQQRADLKAADAQVRAAERAHSAARAERYPSLGATADYGGIGVNASQLQITYTAGASLKIPIWQGGRADGDIQQADAALDQRRAEYDDLKGQIESDVRSAYLDLQAASSQVEVAEKNVAVNKEALELMRQKVEVGVIDNVAYVQAQEEVTNAEFDYINGVFAFNVAKLSLARAMGRAADGLPGAPKAP
ncbi:MAG TPA: TolC family protein [Candidatus Acidoferrales bacterium]|nr:TolC family protein [Candidatus Acidoferrales bacterium]